MILRTCICIPTYNNPETIGSVIQDCLDKTSLPILVIDDGSNPAVRFPENPRVTLIRLPENQGKGRALQQAIRECLRRGFTHLLSMDGDGQHLASDVPRLLEAARENPWDLIIGNRRLEGANVPEISRFGRKFSNFWVKFETDTHISDSQSGFRVYPLFWLQNMSFFTRRFDFEIEVLIRLLWKGVAIREVEVEPHYPDPSRRVSHFDKLWDNVRISLLNTILVTLSLVQGHRSPAKSALALGLGVFIGTSPFFGFHAPIAAMIALVFRLNFLLLFIGTNISIPPLAPILAAASIAAGSRIIGIPTDAGSLFSTEVLTFSKAWLIGFVPVGFCLGSITGLVTYFITRSLHARSAHALSQQQRPAGAPQTKSAWTGKSRGGVIGNWILRTVTRRVGLKAGYFCLYFIIPYFYLFAPKARRACNEFWSTLSPDTSWPRRQWLVLTHLLTFAKVLIDRVWLQAFQSAQQKMPHGDSRGFRLEEIGLEHILEPIKNRQGLILLSSHVGSWDLAASELKDSGLPADFYMVKYEASGMTSDKARGGPGPEHVRSVGVNRVAQPILEIREILASKLPVAMMADRPLANQFELVPFLGKLAPFDTTPFRVAATCGAPLLFTFGFRKKTREYVMTATPARNYRYAPGRDRALQCLEWVTEFAQSLEHSIRGYPQQWFNFYPVFSTPPAAPADVETGRPRNYLREELEAPARQGLA